MQYIFDTNIFDRILDGQVDLKIFSSLKGQIFVTHIQWEEIHNCKNEKRREDMLEIVNEISSSIPTESFVLDYSILGEAKLGDSDIYTRLAAIGIKHIEDALIGETAILNDLTLVSDDKRFAKKVLSLGGMAIGYLDFWKSIT